ncbi:MAG: PorV/PorQ family protein [candidate division WOR-3 bacterium]
MKRYLAIILVIAIPLFADFAKLGTSGAQFLKISVGRGAAMGEAFVAISDDASATYWNPAGLGVIGNRQFALQHNEWIADIKHEYLTGAIPLTNMGTLGFSLTALTMGKMEITDVDDPNTKTVREDTGTGRYFNASDFAVGISFGRMFTDRLAAGFTIKAIQEMIWDMNATGIATDFGIHYNTGFKGLKIAAAMSNFGADISFGGRNLDRSADPFPDSPLDYQKVPVSVKTTPFPLPLIFRFGIAMNPVETEAQRLTVALDLNHPNDNYETINLGLEYGYLNTIFLRAGYKMYLNIDYMKAMTGAEPVYDSTAQKWTYPNWGDNTEWLLNNLTGGVGFNLKMGGREMRIDYAYMNKGVLRATHRIGLLFGF